MHRSLAIAIAVILAAGLSSAAAVTGRVSATGVPAVRAEAEPANRAPVDPPTPAVPSVPAPPVPVPVTVPRPSGAVGLAGCPVPPHPTGPSAPPWHPAVLVPEASLPAPTPPVPTNAGLEALKGKGMWLWKFNATENGDAEAIVTKAAAAGLHQLWVRVGDSQDGFYAADVLAQLVPRAHRKGIAVMGWGFPYLYDPVGDAAWTADALSWRSKDGHGLDGFSPDLETGSEGVAVTERRIQVYLGLARQAAGTRPLVGTVYRPSDPLWAGYPYRAIAPYVDAFAAMVYWGCVEPGAAASQAVQRLSTLRPVHLIGQGYNMGPEGGRQVAPSGDETWRFLDVAHGGGAVGASFWDWQEINQEQWSAMSDFPWPVVSARRVS